MKFKFSALDVVGMSVQSCTIDFEASHVESVMEHFKNLLLSVGFSADAVECIQYIPDDEEEEPEGLAGLIEDDMYE